MCRPKESVGRAANGSTEFEITRDVSPSPFIILKTHTNDHMKIIDRFVMPLIHFTVKPKGKWENMQRS